MIRSGRLRTCHAVRTPCWNASATRLAAMPMAVALHQSGERVGPDIIQWPRHSLRYAGAFSEVARVMFSMQSVPLFASHRPGAPRPVGGSSASTAMVGGISASLALGIGMLVLRSTADVRTIPERVMEWLL